MPNHTKPTQEELDAQAQQALAEAEKLENQETPEEPKQEEAQEKAEEVDYKSKYEELQERYKGSSQESQVLHAKQKKITDAVEQANELPDPTEEELVKEYGDDWEGMSTLERRLAKNDLLYRRKFDVLSGVSKEFKQVNEWTEKVETFIADPKTLNKYQDLEGRQEEFASFASKPSRRGVDFETLVSAFLFENKPTKNKGSLLESGSTGSEQKPKSDKLTTEQAAKLKQKDYRAYVEALKAGKIDTTI